MKHWRAEIALVGNTIIWGSTFVIVKNALADVSPVLFLLLRFLVASVALAIILRGRISGSWRPGALAGVALFAGYALQTAGLRLTSPPKSAFLTGLSIVMVPLLGALVYRNRPRMSELAGVALATVGMALMTLENLALRIGAGDLLTIGCAAAFAAHILVIGHYASEVGFAAIAFVQVATAALLATGSFWWMETPVLRWNPGVIAAVAVTGLLATALAFTVQAWAQQYTTSTRTALIFALEPVFAWLTSYVLAGESLSGRAAAGGVMILAGVLLVELKPFDPEQHPCE